MRTRIIINDVINTNAVCDFRGIEANTVTMGELRGKIAKQLKFSPEEQAAFYLDYNNKDISHPAYDEIPLATVLSLEPENMVANVAMVLFHQPALTMAEYVCLTEKKPSRLKETVNNCRVMQAAVSQDGTALQFASPRLRTNRELVIAAVKQHGHALKYAAVELRKDSKVVLTAVTKKPNGSHKDCRGTALRYADVKLQGQAEIVQAAVESDGHALEYATPDLKDNKHLAYLAVQNCGEAFKYVSPRLKQDSDIAEQAVRNDYKVFHQVPEVAQNTALVVAALDSLNSISGQRSLHWGLFMQSFPKDRFYNDVEFMRTMVQRRDNTFYRLAGPKIFEDKQFVLQALQRDGRLLQKIPEAWRDDHRMVLLAVQENGRALQYAGEDLCHDRELQLVALNSCWEKSIAFPYEKVSVSCQKYLKSLNHTGVQLALKNYQSELLQFNTSQDLKSMGEQVKEPLIYDDNQTPQNQRCRCWPQRFFR